MMMCYTDHCEYFNEHEADPISQQISKHQRRYDTGYAVGVGAVRYDEVGKEGRRYRNQ